MIKKYNKFVKENNVQSAPNYNYLIDYSYLAENCDEDKVKEICEIAKREKFYAICIPSDYVSYAVGYLNDPKIKVVTVIDFPTGTSSTTDKLKEARKVIAEGVSELDVVMNVKLLQKITELKDELALLSDKKDDDKEKSIELKEQIEDNTETLEKDIRTIVEEAHKNGVIVKVIIESGILTSNQIKLACELVESAGADFVMTSTGTAEVGAQVEKTMLMRNFLSDFIQIKAAGGIRTIQDIEAFLPYCDRIGTSVIPKVNLKNNNIQ